MLQKRNIYLAVFTISIVGLALVQYQYLRVGLNLARVQFGQRMAEAGGHIKESLSNNNQLTYLVGAALQRDTTFFKIESDSLQDASSHFLKDYITEKLAIEGIDAPFSYGLYTRDSTYYINSPNALEFNETALKYPIQLQGYLPDLMGQRMVLELHFDNLNAYFLSKLNGLTLPSILFIIGIVATVIWVLRTFYWQRNVITITNEFINNLTHELKTPVFSIGLATKMLDENEKADKKQLVFLIRQQLGRLDHLINKVLELAKLESGTEVLHLQPLDFRPVLEELCGSFATLAPLEQVVFEYQLEPGEYLIKGESSHLGNAINNLLDNAKKYAQEPKIALRAFKENRKLVITVTDNGKGISPEDQKRVFQKYYRVPNGNTHEVKGYGLGLSYVKKIVTAHKGHIQLESELGKGTVISLFIPLDKHGK